MPTTILCSFLLLFLLRPSAVTAFSTLHVKPITKLDVVTFNETHRVDQDVSAFYRKFYPQAKPSAAKSGDLQTSLLYNDSIIATLRLCRPNRQGWIFLRSLCVAPQFRRQGLGLSLISQSMDAVYAKHGENLTGVYCFAEPSLSPLYKQAGFRKSTPEIVPKSVWNRFKAVSRRVGRKGMVLECFQWSHLSLLLLQHGSEVHRIKIATGTLVEATRHVKVIEQVWAGRADNQKLKDLLAEQQGKLVLLWTGGTSDISSFETTNSTFVLLDGTWQEAQDMFRKIPELHQLPRLSITCSEESKYHLRGDYGWKQRFASSATPLCTAEAVSELLQQACNNSVGAELIRKRLDQFQSDRSVPME